MNRVTPGSVQKHAWTLVMLACLLQGRAIASEPESGPGAFVELASWWVAPRNLDIDYAFVDESASLSGGGSVQTLSFERDTSAMIRAGWRFGGSGDPALGITFWEGKVSAAATTGERARGVGALLASPDFAIGRSLVDFAGADSRVRATQVDLDFDWVHELGPRTRIGFSGGLRLFRVEERAITTYRVDSFGTLLEEFVNSTTDSGGIGPKAAMGYGFRFGRGWSFEAGFELALPVGDAEARTTDTALSGGSFQQASVVERSGTSGAFLHVGGRVQVTAVFGRGWTAYCAYRFQYWMDVRPTVRFVDDVAQNAAVRADDDVAFEGLVIGFGHAF